MNVSTMILQAVITIASAIITTVLLPLLAQWLTSKTTNQKLQTAIHDLTQTVATVVDCTEQTMVSQLKADNRWNYETQSQVLNYAVEHIIENLSTSTTKWLEDNSTNITATVQQYVEAYIFSKKQEGTPNEDNSKNT